MSSDFLHFKAKNGGSIFFVETFFFDGIVGVNQVSTRIVVIIIDCKVICKYSPVNKTFNDKVFMTAQNYSKSFLPSKLQIIQKSEVSRQRSLLNKLANQSSH